MEHERSATAMFHSSTVVALWARKFIPTVPNCAALEAWGAPPKTSARQVISNPTNPAATTVAFNSASSRAPAIQPFQRSTLRLSFGDTVFETRISPIWSRPPGLSTRDIS